MCDDLIRNEVPERSYYVLRTMGERFIMVLERRSNDNEATGIMKDGFSLAALEAAIMRKKPGDCEVFSTLANATNMDVHMIILTNCRHI